MPSDLALAAENTWEGVSKLPDWQCKFPNWRRSNLRTSYAALSNHGVGLLEGLLAYDPRVRLAGKDALAHAYFDTLDTESVGKGPIR